MGTAKGIEITKLDATPRGLMEAGSGTGKLRVFMDTIANFVWEDGGLTSDPGVPLRIALTIETVAGSAAAGDITMIVQYVVN